MVGSTVAMTLLAIGRAGQMNTNHMEGIGEIVRVACLSMSGSCLFHLQDEGVEIEQPSLGKPSSAHLRLTVCHPRYFARALSKGGVLGPNDKFIERPRACRHRRRHGRADRRAARRIGIRRGLGGRRLVAVEGARHGIRPDACAASVVEGLQLRPHSCTYRVSRSAN